MSKAQALGKILIEIGATTAKMQATFREAKTEIKNFGHQFEELKTVIEGALAFKAAEFAIDKIKELGESFGKLAVEGDNAKDIAEAFDRLGGSSKSLERAKVATEGLIDKFQLMALENKGLLSQGPAFDRYFSDIAKVASSWAKSQGKDAVEATEKLTEAFVKGKTSGLIPFGIVIDKTAPKTEQLAQMMKQLRERADEVVVGATGAGKAFEQLEVQMGESRKEFAEGFDDSDKLRDAYQKLAKVVLEVDWRTIGKEIGDVAGTIINELSPAIKSAASLVERLALGFEVLFGDSLIAKITRASDALASAKKDLASYQSPWFGGLLVKDNKIKGAQAEVDARQKELNDLQQQYLDLKKKQDDAGKSGEDAGKRTADALRAEALAAKEAAAKVAALAAKERESAQASLDRERVTDRVGNIKSDFSQALQGGNFAAAQDFLNQYRPAVHELALDHFAAMKKAGADVTDADVKAYEEKFIGPMSAEVQDEMSKAFDQSLKHLVSGMEEFTSSIEQIVGGLNEAFGVKMPKGMQKVLDIAKGIFSVFEGVVRLFESMAQISKAISVLSAASSPGGAVGSIAGSATGGALGGSLMTGGIGALIGSSGMTAGAAQAAGLAGPAMADGMFASGSGLMGFAAANPYTTAAIAAFAIGSQTNWFGLGGAFHHKKNEDTVARKKVAEYFSQKGVSGLDFNSKQFNEGGAGWDAFKAMPKQSQAAFSAVGEQVKSVLGITQNIGPQIGAILATSIGDSATKLGAVMKKLGIDAKQVESSMVAAGKEGSKSWLEVEGSIEAVEKASTAGSASMKAAADEFIQSNGRGQQALDGLRDSAIAAQKAGAETLAQYAVQLKKGGMDETQVNDIMKAFAQRGIKNLDDVVKSTDRTAGAVVADVTAMGFQFEDLSTKVDAATTAINKFSAAAAIIPTPDISATAATPVTAHAMGDVFDSPMLFRSGGRTHVLGEAGSEAVMPLTRINGVLGVKATSQGGGRGSPGMTIVVNAQGAAPGMEHVISRAIRSIEQSVYDRTIMAVSDLSRRGAL